MSRTSYASLIVIGLIGATIAYLDLMDNSTVIWAGIIFSAVVFGNKLEEAQREIASLQNRLEIAEGEISRIRLDL
ncbi:hypothetical protein U8C33_24460 [Sinorhizobium meliloti]|uniref:hypothetical protein n=1 Tax=Rhizobium meliloti TaxID=382 RepID=UPI0004A41BBC|nr:hypothetical protein [Sinorhizobium meliloti]ARS72222.1 hypothetical protein SMRU11_35890 [Sinorhizobium meliloti RU11/001]RVI12671.1 hypothetical protein CN206_10610 [Sinorhizobium meliloti]RVI28993.1 hypothetical protein CN207_12010 [Sinorhizobium meliloti]RVP08796.1 hypothetical protein CN109_30010 [Sinorhizobium meliloti]WQP22104.1 hypothetical protein U8C33_24460 [Sinorhizobium meliloti]